MREILAHDFGVDGRNRFQDSVTRLDQKSIGEIDGAGDRGRTGDVQLGKLAFYH